MPCQDPYRSIEVEDPETRRRLDTATQFLCYLCGETIENGEFFRHVDERLIAWWDEHNEADRQRVQEVVREMFRSRSKLGSLIESDFKNVVKSIIADAEAVHPVSRWHVEWFKSICIRVYNEFKGVEFAASKAQEHKAAGLAKLSVAEREALGL